MSVSINSAYQPSFNSGNVHFTKSTSIFTSDKVKENLGKFGNAAYRYGITLTGMLPLSSRGVILNFTLGSVFIPLCLIKNIGPGFVQKMKEGIEKQWNQGIHDSYINLESAKNTNLRKQVVNENLRYATYMYKGFQEMDNSPSEGGEDSILVEKSCVPTDFPKEHVPTLKNIQGKLVEMGFQSDGCGNFYNTDTANMFNLVYDKKKKEIAICFMGMGNQDAFLISDEEKWKLTLESMKAAGADWFGGIPASTRQAIEIGKMLKESTTGTGVTPVMVGHSHGGGLAQAGAAANGVKAIVFNSRPMGAGTRRYIGQSKIAENAKNITTFSGRGDWLSGNVTLNRLAVIFERLTGIPVPRSVGVGYHLPKLPGGSNLENHVGFHEEMIALRDM